MNPQASLYLDASRFLAAVAVLLHHLLQPPFFPETIGVPGRSAVIVFFVVSGFVIAYVTDTRETDWRKYTVNRMGRIYSVALPALLLTGILYAAGRALDGGTTPQYDYPVVRLVMAMLFLNQIWNFTVQPLANGPYWSLCYEVWYYVMFGLWCFAGPRWRLPAIALVALIVGPRILLLAPIWLMGVGLYYLLARSPQRWWPGAEWLFIACVIALVAAILGANPAQGVAEGIRDSLVDGRINLFGYGVFIGGNWVFPLDYVVGALFTATIFLAAKSRLRFDENGRGPRTIRFLSSYTFSLYLYHAPLLVFFYAVTGPFAEPLTGATAQIGLVLFVAFLLGTVTERHKRPYAAFFARLFSRPAHRKYAQ